MSTAELETVLGDYWHAFAPAPEIGLAEYSIRKVFNEEGRPFDFLAFPHMVAPGGPMDAFDASWCREIVMQWASRLGKTFIVLCGSLYFSELAPCNQILAGHVQDLADQQTERVRVMGGFNPYFDDSGLQTTQKRRLRFAGNTIYGAWARSPGTLSNINALFGGASELDLWERVSTSKHPDPEEMFGDRFKDNDTLRKEIYESIPTLKGTYFDETNRERPKSRIEARRIKGSDCRLWLCCPICGAPQVLEIENVKVAGYICAGCRGVITDEYRKPFIRSGVWAPRGCTVKSGPARQAASMRLDLLEQATELDEGTPELDAVRDRLQWRGWQDCDYLEGAPENIGTVESYQLSSLYALSLSWERICAQPQDTQNFINQWLGETADDEGLETVPLTIGIVRGTEAGYHGRCNGRDKWAVPDWSEVITGHVDVGMRVLNWSVNAHGPEGLRDVIAYGATSTEQPDVIGPEEAILAGLHKVRSIIDTQVDANLVLVDCGYQGNQKKKKNPRRVVYEFVMSAGEHWVPAMGLAAWARKDRTDTIEPSWTGAPWYYSEQEYMGQEVWVVDFEPGHFKHQSQGSYLIMPTEDGGGRAAGSVTLFGSEALRHNEFAEQMNNERHEIDHSTGKAGWKRYGHNHYFDTDVGNLVALSVHESIRLAEAAAAASEKPAASSVQAPDGRAFFVGDRQ